MQLKICARNVVEIKMIAGQMNAANAPTPIMIGEEARKMEQIMIDCIPDNEKRCRINRKG